MSLRKSDDFYGVILWISFCCECFVFSCRYLCDGLIRFTEESCGFLSVVSVVFVSCRSPRRADHLYRGVLWMSVCFECCVLSGTVLCDVLFPFTEESYACLFVVSVVCCQVDIFAKV